MALHVLTGKFKGQEFLLPEEGDFVLGKGGPEEVLFDEKVFPRVAVVSVQGDQVQLTDVATPTGIYVNKSKVESVKLKEGDQVRIGKTRFMLVKVIRYSQVAGEAKARAAAAEAARQAAEEGVLVADSTPASTGGLQLLRGGVPEESGSLDQFSLGDLLRYYCVPERSGVLSLTTEGDLGAVMISGGQLADAFIASSPAPNAKRALFRLFRWKSGDFVFQPDSPRTVVPIFKEPLETILMQAEEERDAIEAMAAALPPLDSRLAVGKLPPGNVTKLAPAEMFILGLVRMHGTVRGIIDNHPENDLVVCRLLIGLLRRNIVCVAESLV